MKKLIFTVFFSMLCIILFAQEKPVWMDADIRNLQYPQENFLTGFAEGNVNAGENIDKAVSRIKTSAQTDLLEGLKVTVKSNTKSEIGAVNNNGNYNEFETLSQISEKSVAADVIGLNVEHFFDKKKNYIYAFAFVKKTELADYYKKNLSLNVSQAENLLLTAKNLENKKDYASANKQCEDALINIGKIRYTQDLLTALDKNISQNDLQQSKVDNIFSEIKTMQTRMEQSQIADKINAKKNELQVAVSQVENTLKTANDLLNSNEKTRAKSECATALSGVEKVRKIQSELKEMNKNLSSEELQITKSENLYAELTKMQAKLAQGVYVFIENTEDLFGQKVDVVSNKIKADLATNGCSFVDTPEKADFKLKITVSTRKSSQSDEMVFCFADTQIELYDTHKQKVVFSDEIAQKGASDSLEKAGRKAMTDVAKKVVDNLKNWLK